MAYIVQADIESVFGVENVAVWSNLANDSATADTARIASAIENAEEEVESRFLNGEYAVPFTAERANGLVRVKSWCARLAGVWLYNSRGIRAQNQNTDANAVRGHYKAALEEMDAVIAGQRALGCTLNSGTETDAPQVV